MISTLKIGFTYRRQMRWLNPETGGIVSQGFDHGQEMKSSLALCVCVSERALRAIQSSSIIQKDNDQDPTGSYLSQPSPFKDLRY